MQNRAEKHLLARFIFYFTLYTPERAISYLQMPQMKNIDIRWPKGYTDVAKQVNNRTAGEDGCKVCVFIFEKNACSCFAYFAAICPVRKTCLAAGAMRFLCAASAAHFLFSGTCVFYLSSFYGLYRTVQKLYNQFMKIRLAREAADRRQRKTEEEKT